MESKLESKTLKVGSTYQITVKGRVDAEYINRLNDLTVSNLESENQVISTLTGRMRDQSELNGILNILHDHQFEVISVTKISS